MMNIDPIVLDRLSISKLNMRSGKKPPYISDILPSIISRGVIMPLIVRPKAVPESAEEEADNLYEILAGKRRYYASLEAAKQQDDVPCLPCIILAEGDDADALEISMIENMLRQAPDPVTQWESYTRLVKEGRSVDAIAATFALTELQVKRILTLGNLLPRILEFYRAGTIDGETVKHLTLASKAQQKAWLALLNDEGAHAPRGAQLKAWLFNRLLGLPDSVVMDILAIVMAETLASGTPLIETIGTHLGVNMADYWQADSIFFELLRDREVATAILAEVGGDTVAQANADQKLKVIKSVINDHLSGAGGRTKVARWLPRWMAFPPSAYTTRGGVATVDAASRAKRMAEEGGPALEAGTNAASVAEGEGAGDSDGNASIDTDADTAEAFADAEAERLAA